MAPRRRRLAADEVVQILQRHGFSLVGQKGSHQKWRNAETGKQVIVPAHRGKPLPLGTLLSIVRSTGIPEQHFK